MGRGRGRPEAEGAASWPLQASSQSMPWLADLVQASEGSLDVLPVQCLCEFLLHDAADDAASGEEEEEGGSKEQKAKKRQVGAGPAPPSPFCPPPSPAHPEVPLSPQRQQKQQQLLGRLQDLLLGPKADEQTTCEVLDYFLRRLGSSQVASRVLAMKVSAAARCPVRATPQVALLPAGGRAHQVSCLVLMGGLRW